MYIIIKRNHGCTRQFSETLNAITNMVNYDKIYTSINHVKYVLDQHNVIKGNFLNFSQCQVDIDL